MEKIKNYPSHIARPFTAFAKADDESAMHKSLLDMGESFLTYLVGIMFGEYKRSGEISDRLESEFYKYSSRKPSFGVFLSFMRLLSKEMNETILTDKFEKGKKYLSVSEFISEFELLKKVINDGADDGFSEKVAALRKGHTAGQKGLMDFFNIFISIRNTYAHPDDKAGPSDEWKNNNPKPPKKDKTGMDEYNVKMKSALRKWPLGDDYYSFINPLMHAALSELVEDFEILQSYKPILAKLLDDKNKKGTFVVELGAKESELELELSTDDLRFMNTDLRYLLDPEDKLFVKLYYHAIPQLNPDVAKKIIDREKAKAMEPHMREMIHAKLVDDGKIDDMEYLVLRDTAKTSAINDEKLFQLIEQVKNQLGIKDSVGTPDNLGDIFIEAKDSESNPKFNPWWLGYLSMVGKIDKKVVKGEQAQEKKIEQSIKKLKANKKSLPVMKRLANAKKKLKDKKAQKSKQIKKINERIAAKREMRKKASKPERKRNLLEEIDELKTKVDERREYFDDQIKEFQERFNKDPKYLIPSWLREASQALKENPIYIANRLLKARNMDLVNDPVSTAFYERVTPKTRSKLMTNPTNFNSSKVVYEMNKDGLDTNTIPFNQSLDDLSVPEENKGMVAALIDTTNRGDPTELGDLKDAIEIISMLGDDPFGASAALEAAGIDLQEFKQEWYKYTPKKDRTLAWYPFRTSLSIGATE